MGELKITRLGSQGDGVAETPDGRFYLPYTLPGDVVWDGAPEDLKILRHSGHRSNPTCAHFQQCGGCTLQHANDIFLADWKRDEVKRALNDLADGVDFRPTLTSPPQSRRRAKLSGRRTKKGTVVGFYARNSDNLISVPDCKILHPDILAGFAALHELTKIGATRKNSIAFMVTRSAAGLDVDVRDAKPGDQTILTRLAALSSAHDLARLSWNGETVSTRAPPLQHFGKTPVVPPIGAFLQATEHGQDALIHAVLKVLGPAKKVLDLFAGCGTFSLPIAERAKIEAVESDSAMLAALNTAWRGGAGLLPLTPQVRDLFRRPLLHDELAQFDAAVIDPPRAGARAQIAEISDSDLPRLAYVSCNPQTFARDTRSLINGGYRLDWIQTIDQFRWSAHVELVAQFVRP